MGGLAKWNEPGALATGRWLAKQVFFVQLQTLSVTAKHNSLTRSDTSGYAGARGRRRRGAAAEDGALCPAARKRVSARLDRPDCVPLHCHAGVPKRLTHASSTPSSVRHTLTPVCAVFSILRQTVLMAKQPAADLDSAAAATSNASNKIDPAGADAPKGLPRKTDLIVWLRLNSQQLQLYQVCLGGVSGGARVV